MLFYIDFESWLQILLASRRGILVICQIIFTFVSVFSLDLKTIKSVLADSGGIDASLRARGSCTGADALSLGLGFESLFSSSLSLKNRLGFPTADTNFGQWIHSSF